MAAIIAQMTRANRERKKKKRYEISKCMYNLPSYSRSFEPDVHNKYLRAKRELQEKFSAMQFHRLVSDRMDEILLEREGERTFHMRYGVTLFS